MTASKLPKLKLPEFDYRFTEKDDQLHIFDVVRKKYVLLTPEEWVRQHFIHLLINHLSYPRSLIRIEKGLKYDKVSKRTDIEVLDKQGNTFLIVECKAAEITLNKKTLMQASTYNSVKKSRFLAVSNGNKHYVWEYDAQKNNYVPLNDFPSFPV